MDENYKLNIWGEKGIKRHMNIEKIATVTVTYNRKNLLMENIDSVLKQTYKVDKIIIVDNHSTDDTQKMISDKYKDNDRIKYIYLNENIGGAGGFYTGCKYAFEKGYDWIILMDDDGKPSDMNTIENLILEVEKQNLTSNDKIMLNSLVVYNEEQLSFNLLGTNNLQEITKKARDNVIVDNINPFNGTLISKGLIDSIGFPNKDFFIKGDEYDYFCRALKQNAYIATVMNSLYYHPKIDNGHTKIVKIFNKELKFFIEAPWKEYYRTRNYTYSYIKSNNRQKARKEYIKRILGALICKCKKITTIKMIVQGYKDGQKGKLGNTVKP